MGGEGGFPVASCAISSIRSPPPPIGTIPSRCLSLHTVRMARKKLNDGMDVGFSCIAFFINPMLDLPSVSRTRIIRSEEDSGICSGEYRGNTKGSGRYRSGSPAPLKVVTIAPCWCKGDRCNTTLRVANTPPRCQWGNPSIWHFTRRISHSKIARQRAN